MSATTRPWQIVPLLAMFGLGATDPGVRLIDAVKAADVQEVRKALQRHVPVNVADRSGETALHWAVVGNDVKMVGLLLQAGADPRTENRYGVSPLSVAVLNGSPAIVELLLKAGADANTVRLGGETVLMTAARNGNPDVVQLLLAHGANVNVAERVRGQTALMWAAARNNAAAVKLLIQAGADLDRRSHAPESRLGDTDVAVESTGAVGSKKRPRIDDYTALLFAVRAGSIDAVHALLDAGADPNTAAPDGVTALIVAVFNANWEVGSLLLEYGADPTDARPGWTALHQVARTRNLSHFRVPHPVANGSLTSLDLVNTLLAYGANVNAQATKKMSGDGERGPFLTIGATPLLIAAKGFDVDLMRLLLANGADIKLRNVVGTSVIMAAAACDTTYLNEEIGPLTASLEAVKLAWEAGAGVNETNEIGDTALHGAAYTGAIPVAEFLIEKGAKLDVQNEYGWTPLATATLVYVGGNIVSQPAMAARLRQIHEERKVPMVVRTIEEAYDLARKVYVTRYKSDGVKESTAVDAPNKSVSSQQGNAVPAPARGSEAK